MGEQEPERPLDQLVREAGLKETGILTSISDYHIFKKLGSNREAVINGYLEVVDAALADGAGAAEDAGADDGVAPAQAEAMKIAVIAAATERYRDPTLDPPLALVPSVQHIGQMAVGWTLWHLHGRSQDTARGSAC